MAKKSRNHKSSASDEKPQPRPETGLSQESGNTPEVSSPAVQTEPPEPTPEARPDIPLAESKNDVISETDVPVDNNLSAQSEPPEPAPASEPEIPATEPESSVTPETEKAPADNSPAAETQPSQQAAEPEPEKKAAPEEIFADIRQSLVEEEKLEEKKPRVSRWLRDKVKTAKQWYRSKQDAKEATEAVEANEENDVPQTLMERFAVKEAPAVPAAAEVKPEVPQPEKAEVKIEPPLPVIGPEQPVAEKAAEEPKPEIQVEGPAVETAKVEEKPSLAEVKQKMAAHKEGTEDYQTIRDVALQDYAEPTPEPVVRQFTTPGEYFKNLILGLTKFEKRLLIGASAAILVIILLAFSYNLFVKPQLSVSAEATATAKANLPYPVMVTLPGGWTFNLNKGAVQNGVWNPAGAEWLAGTEICRWIGLPWSLQLESVIRTLKADDQVELIMSNSDHLIYRVQSIRSVAAGDIQSLDQDVPSLLIILVNSESDMRWVVTAIP